MNSKQLVFLLLAVHSSQAADKWTGKWFPRNPEEKVTESTIMESTSSSTKKWIGKWFPADPNSSNEPKSGPTAEWKGKWFPGPHDSKDDANKLADFSSNDRKDWKENGDQHGITPEADYKESSYDKDRIMGIPNPNCDDGEVNIQVDFDPSNTALYTCLESSYYKPNSDLEPIETVYTVPKFYTPVHKCMNESIAYDQKIPTLGYHRPLWPMYGEYKYVPPQRWLHSLEHGAIVMLYDNCALQSEVEKLKKLLKSCLYRHIITPYKLTKERPLALVAWGTSLEMSAYDQIVAADFIKTYAKSGPEKVSRQGQYKKMLIEESKIISDSDDSEVCANLSNMM